MRRRCNPLTELLGKMPRHVVALWIAVGGWACSPAGHKEVRHATQQDLRQVEVDRTIISSDEALTAFELLTRGKRRLNEERFNEAATDLELVVAQDPTGPWLADALFHSAHAHEAQNDHAGAASRFARVGKEFPRSPFAREARLRALRLYVYLEQWAGAGTLANEFMADYPTRVPREELVVRGALALALIGGEGVTPEARSSAAAHIAVARRVIARYQLDSAGHIPRDLAQVYFALAELKRLEGEDVTFDPLPVDFPAQLERRAQLLLDAQSAYSDVMRAYDAHWSAMAGYRVAELYQRLHRDLVQAPRPPGVDTERRQLIFEAALRLRYTILLKKGLGMIEHTLAMASRTNEQSAWVNKAQATRQQLFQAYEQEQAAIDASPYTREDLERTLAELQKRKHE